MRPMANFAAEYPVAGGRVSKNDGDDDHRTYQRKGQA